MPLPHCGAATEGVRILADPAKEYVTSNPGWLVDIVGCIGANPGSEPAALECPAVAAWLERAQVQAACSGSVWLHVSAPIPCAACLPAH